jgi:hypothetical protein
MSTSIVDMNTILSILPSGLTRLVQSKPDIDSGVINTIIGPILDPYDLEAGIKYYIYCYVDKQASNHNCHTLLNQLVHKKSPFSFVHGQVFVTKVVEYDTVVNFYKNDIDIFTRAINATDRFIWKPIQSINTNLSTNDFCSWISCLGFDIKTIDDYNTA